MRFYTSVVQHKSNFLVRGYENGKRISRKVKYKPYLFLPSKDHEAEYKTIKDQRLDRIDFDSVWDAREFIKQYEDVTGFEYFGLTDFPYVYINDTYEGEVKFDADLISVVSLDIETDGIPDIRLANKEITAITLGKKGRYVSFGCGDYIPTNKETQEYYKCRDEEQLLRLFLKTWNTPEWSPDVITHWNGDTFDIPYLVNRIRRILGDEDVNKLSPWGIIEEKIINYFGRETQTYIIAGITSLDYMALDKKFSYKNRESYRLDSVCQEVLGIGKLDFSEYDSLFDLHKRDFQKYMEYNYNDVLLLDKLEEHQGFIQQVFYLAYDAKVNYIDTLATVKPWTVIFHNFLMSQKIILPTKKYSKGSRDLIGGYVKSPDLGRFDWLVSFDFTSLYPSLIRHYNISPDTFVKKLNHPGITDVDEFEAVKNIINGKISEIDIPDEYSMTANLCLFRKDKLGFIPAMMKKLFDDRVHFKNLMKEAQKQYELTPTIELKKSIQRYDNLQMTRKIQLNSCYGALGNAGFIFFDINLAEAITMSGQLAIRWTEKYINDYLNKLMKTNKDWIVAIDTDSVTGDTEIYNSNVKIKIEDLYNKIATNENLIKKRDENDYIHDVSKLDLYTKSVKNNKVCDDKIIKIMKHKVKKRLYKITVDNKSVIVTEDHSIIVNRDGVLVGVKPTEIQYGEKVIYINTLDTGMYQEQIYEKENN